MVRKILDWCDRKMDEAYAEEKSSKAFSKAFKSGFVEGAVDGFAAWGAVLTAIGVVCIVKNTIKK